MLHLKQSTASQSVLIGPFVDDTTGADAETGLSIANTDIRLSKNGANIAAKNSGGGTHDELGYYQITLDATDTNTVGRLQLMVDVSGALPVYHEFQVLEESIYDALYGASAAGFDANGRVDVGSWAGTAVTLGNGAPDVNIASTDDIDLSATQKASVNAEVDTALADIGLDHLISSALPTGWGTDVASGSVFDNIADDGTAAFDRTTDSLQAIADSGGGGPTAAQIADAVWDEDQADHTTAGTFGETATEIASILVDTAEIGSAGAGLSSIPWNSSWDPEVQSEVTDALNAYDPPTNAELTAAVANVSVDEIQATALADLFNTDSGTTYGSAVAGSPVKEIADNAGGSSLTVADIADGVWDEAQSGHTTGGTFGEIATEIASILADTNELQTDDIPGTLTTIEGKIDTVDGNVDSILVDTGTTLENHLTDIKGGTFSGATDSLEAIRDRGDAEWITATGFSTHSAADVRSDVDSNSTQLAAIVADTDELQGDWANGGRLDLILDARASQTSVDGLNDLSSAEVNAEVVDALATDTYAEPGQGTPSATLSLAAKINYLFKAWRNRSTQTATTYSLYNDDATTVDQKATVSDDGTTADKGEVATGP